MAGIDDDDDEALLREANQVAGIPAPEPKKAVIVKRAAALAPSPGSPAPAGPDLTFHAFQRRMSELCNHQDTITPALMLSAAVGRMQVAVAKRKEGIRLTQMEEENFVRDMAQCLYYISSLADQVPVSLQRVAEIAMTDVESAAIKRLHPKR
jgi:hypothetical protein